MSKNLKRVCTRTCLNRASAGQIIYGSYEIDTAMEVDDFDTGLTRMFNNFDEI